ncbi:MAG: RNA methyltransferase [Candidatus Aceula meridiana]|nr:RNA methyltransferase [Candidatus Aceula meridiana]
MLSQEITSLQNSHIKAVVKLRDKKHRDQTGLMIVEGKREISRAKQAGIVFKEIYFSKDFLAQDANQEFQMQVSEDIEDIFDVEDNVFEKICFGQRNEGILAVCLQPKKTWADLRLGKKPLLVILEGLEKPGNLGAVLRTCDGAGVDGLIICDGITDIYNPNVVRASTGVVFSIPVIQATSQEAIDFLKDHQILICATLPDAEKDYADVDMNIPLALVMGNEQKGLSKIWQMKADQKVRIPMKGKADSLNVSVTTSVIIYEAIRQRKRSHHD